MKIIGTILGGFTVFGIFIHVDISPPLPLGKVIDCRTPELRKEYVDFWFACIEPQNHTKPVKYSNVECTEQSIAQANHIITSCHLEDMVNSNSLGTKPK
jgi:hypothetical protein